MTGDDNSDVPPRPELSDQADAAIEADVRSAKTNVDPDDMTLDAGVLFIQATEQTRMALCLSDPHAPDMPIIYTNKAFCDLTGYDRDEIVGQNCRFLQGPDTEPKDVQRIRDAIASERVAVIDILNYRKDGTPFWNALHIGPIYNKDGELQYFYGSQWDVTEVLRQREEVERQRQVARELQHRTGNLFAVMTSIVRMSARGESDANALADKIERRLGALAQAHRVSISAGEGDGNSSNLRGLVDAVVLPYQCEENERITVKGEALPIPLDRITPIGLTLHELATNALKYGSLSTEDGTVSIEWGDHGDELAICWIERGGPALSADEIAGKKGTGSRIVRGILSGIDATIERNYAPEGLTATIRMPSVTDG